MLLVPEEIPVVVTVLVNHSLMDVKVGIAPDIIHLTAICDLVGFARLLLYLIFFFFFLYSIFFFRLTAIFATAVWIDRAIQNSNEVPPPIISIGYTFIIQSLSFYSIPNHSMLH